MKHNVIQNVYHDTKPMDFWQHNCDGSLRAHITGTSEAPVPPQEQADVPLDVDEHYVSPYDHSEKWSRVKKSGVIKMTPYSRSHITSTNHLGVVRRNSYFSGQLTDVRCCSGVQKKWLEDQYDLHSFWDECRYFTGWRSKYPSLPYLKADIGYSDAELQHVKTSVWSDLLHTYNLGEELGELAETARFLNDVLRTVRHPLRELADYRRYLREKKIKGAAMLFADKWMQYRYAIMPLIYSAEDIMKIWRARDNLYKGVSRSFQGHAKSPLVPDGLSCFYERVNLGTVSVKVGAKARWSLTTLQSLDQIGINPIVTAYNLTPYTFVLDWFINLGDWLSGTLESLSALSEQRSGYVSVRQNYQVDTFLHLEWDERYHREIVWPSSGGDYCGGRTLSLENGDERSVTVKLISESKNSYQRVLFDESDLELSLSPYLNWKRYVDGSILSLRAATSLLRKLEYRY